MTHLLLWDYSILCTNEQGPCQRRGMTLLAVALVAPVSSSNWIFFSADTVVAVSSNQAGRF
ncbi:hypothetical protein JZU51_01205, partial [bacterium]|nr:hypothetical protein [bacterium]